MMQTQTRYDKEIVQVNDNNRRLLEEMNKTMDSMPSNYKETCEVLRSLQSHRSDERSKVEAEFQTVIRRMDESKEKALAQQKEQYEYWLEKKVSELRGFVAQYNEYKEAKTSELEVLENQLLQTFSYSQALAGIIENYENGLYAVYEKAGVKVVQIPSAHKPLPLSDELMRTVNKYRQRALDYSAVNKMGLDTEAPTGGSGVARVGSGLRLVGATVPEDINALSLQELRNLCIQLTQRGATASSEKSGHRSEAADALEEQVLNDLADHPTVEYIKRLEDERDYYKQQLAEEVKANRHAKTALDSKQRQIQKLMVKQQTAGSGRSTAMSNRSLTASRAASRLSANELAS